MRRKKRRLERGGQVINFRARLRRGQTGSIECALVPRSRLELRIRTWGTSGSTASILVGRPRMAHAVQSGPRIAISAGHGFRVSAREGANLRLRLVAQRREQQASSCHPWVRVPPRRFLKSKKPRATLKSCGAFPFQALQSLIAGLARCPLSLCARRRLRRSRMTIRWSLGGSGSIPEGPPALRPPAGRQKPTGL